MTSVGLLPSSAENTEVHPDQPDLYGPGGTGPTGSDLPTPGQPISCLRRQNSTSELRNMRLWHGLCNGL